MNPKICLIMSPQGLEAIRISASTEEEEVRGERLLESIQGDLDELHKKCISQGGGQ